MAVRRRMQPGLESVGGRRRWGGAEGGRNLAHEPHMIRRPDDAWGIDGARPEHTSWIKSRRSRYLWEPCYLMTLGVGAG